MDKETCVAIPQGDASLDGAVYGLHSILRTEFQWRKVPEPIQIELDLDGNLEDFGLNSVQFIKVVVEIENEFDIEFDDEELNLEKFSNLDDIINAIIKKISEQK